MDILKTNFFGKIAVDLGFVSVDDMAAALVFQADNIIRKKKIGEILYSRGVMTKEGIMLTLAKQLGLEVKPNLTIDQIEFAYFSFDFSLAFLYRAIPFAKIDGVVHIAMDWKTLDVKTFDNKVENIKRLLDSEVKVFLTEPESISMILRQIGEHQRLSSVVPESENIHIPTYTLDPKNVLDRFCVLERRVLSLENEVAILKAANKRLRLDEPTV